MIRSSTRSMAISRGQERDARPLDRRPDREGERERRFSARDVAAKHDEIASAKSAAEQRVEALKAGGDGLARRRAVADGVDLRQENGKRRDVRATSHGP